MSLTDPQMRDEVIKAYQSKPGWRAKVLKMKPAQVFAIWKRLQNRPKPFRY